MNQDHYFTKLNFSDEQLDAIRTIYFKYFEDKMCKVFRGVANIAAWNEESLKASGIDLFSVNKDFVIGFTAFEAEADPLWKLFDNLLPYMSFSAVITRMTPFTEMEPHIDRENRAGSIYFPIIGCNPECVTSIYERIESNVRPALHAGRPATLLDRTQKPLYQLCLGGNAFIVNTTEFHGVVNNQNTIRIALGWNFKQAYKKYEDCVEILSSLGYVK